MAGSKPIHGYRTMGADGKQRRPRAYAAWVNMRQRCTNSGRADFVNYGGRGISYCARWDSFVAFVADMGEPADGMTLDRRENNADYSPDNCRWVPRAVQSLNRRNNVRYAFDGKNQTLAEWSRETGIGRTTMLLRVRRGWPIERVLFEAPAY